MKLLITKFGKLLEKQLGNSYRGYRWFVNVFLCSKASEIAIMLGIPPADAELYRASLISTFKQDFDLLSFASISQQAKKVPRCILQTGILGLDSMLGGGFRTGRVYQLFGNHGSGKTELVYHLICRLLSRSKDELVNENPAAVFIDTNNAFRPERLMEVSHGTVNLSSIKVAKCYSLQHLITLLRNVENLLQNQDVRLVVIDSIVATSFSLHDDELPEKYQLLHDVLESLSRITQNDSVCVIFTNDASKDGIHPAGGDLILHRSDYAIAMKKSEFDPASIKAQLVKAIDLPDGKARFRIISTGLTP
nr:ATPase domain-containing protein [Candidatus Sigynarchaeota archaeon]